MNQSRNICCLMCARMCVIRIRIYGFDCLQSVGLSNIQKIGNAQVISIEYVIISIALSLKIQMENQNDNKLVNPIVKTIEMKLTPHISAIGMISDTNTLEIE